MGFCLAKTETITSFRSITGTVPKTVSISSHVDDVALSLLTCFPQAVYLPLTVASGGERRYTRRFKPQTLRCQVSFQKCNTIAETFLGQDLTWDPTYVKNHSRDTWFFLNVMRRAFDRPISRFLSIEPSIPFTCLCACFNAFSSFALLGTTTAFIALSQFIYLLN